MYAFAFWLVVTPCFYWNQKWSDFQLKNVILELHEAEIKKMINDAEANSEADRKFEELIQIRNQADQLIHSTKKQLDENKTKIEIKDQENIKSALNDLEQSLKGENKSEIEKNIQNLLKISSKLAEIHQKTTEDNLKNQNQSSTSKQDENVVDAEFEEIKDSKK